MLIDMLYFVIASYFMAQRKYVIIPGGPYGNRTVSLN